VTQVDASTTPVTIQVSNKARVGLTLVNDSTSALYLGISREVTTTDALWVVGPRASWTLPLAYTGAVWGLWNVATGEANVTEFT
jgi:hypothetical protein